MYELGAVYVRIRVCIYRELMMREVLGIKILLGIEQSKVGVRVYIERERERERPDHWK